jgi:histone deacetylase complex regulatory component SIN3
VTVWEIPRSSLLVIAACLACVPRTQVRGKNRRSPRLTIDTVLSTAEPLTVTNVGTSNRPPSVEPEQHEDQTIEPAVQYVRKIKQRCDAETYRAFLDILSQYHAKPDSTDEVQISRTPPFNTLTHI